MSTSVGITHVDLVFSPGNAGWHQPSSGPDLDDPAKAACRDALYCLT